MYPRRLGSLPEDASPFWKFAVVVLTLLRPLFCSLVVEGRENVPERGGAVIACNHPGGVDVLVLGYASPRQIYFMAKHELFQVHPWFSALIAGLGAFPIRRGRRDRSAVAMSVRLVRDGRVLGMFPEGTRNRGGGLRAAKPGAVRIALKAGVPIVPAAVTGVPELHRTWMNPLRRPRVSVRFAPPVNLEGTGEDAEQVQARTDQVMRAIAALLPPELRGVYGEPEPSIPLDSQPGPG